MSGRKNGADQAAVNRTNGKAVSPALAKSVSLHLEGKRKEALRELNTAIENGEETAEVFAAKGHIQFELEQYDDAIKTYEKLLDAGAAPSHREFQPGHLLREAGPLAGSHRRLPEGARSRSAARGSAARPGHLPAASGKAGTGDRVLRQGAGAPAGS